MDSIVEFAKELKKRDNPKVQGVSVGTVKSAMPELKIAVNGLLLDSSRLMVAKHLIAEYNTSSASVGDHGDHIHVVSDTLAAGEKVIVIPSADNSTYYIVDKVGDV